MSKRKRFIITSLVLSLGFIGIQFLPDQFRFIAIGGLGLATLGLFIWSLWESLGLNMTLLVLILPVLFTLGVGVFWFLLPASFFIRFPIVILFGLGIYGWISSANIYVVAALTKAIPLLRTARGIGFVLSLLTSFLIFDAVFSLRLIFPITAALVFLLTFPLYWQGFWTIELGEKFSLNLVKISLISALVTSEMAIALHFWPVTVVVGSLFLTATFYMLLGLGQSKLEGRLFSQTVRDYLLVGLFVFIGMYFATRWGG